MTEKPRILFYDIETFPNIVTSWGLWVNGALDHNNILQERTIICGSWKWQGEKNVNSVAVDSTDPINDKHVVQTLHDVVSSADAIVHHNGDRFDIKWLRARAVFHGLDPIPPVVQIDTKKIAKSAFYFNSNRLDYLAKFLGIGSKLTTEFGLWKACLEGDEQALLKMVKYNRHDVVLLEQVFNRLAPHVPAKLNRMLFTERDVCQHCGSKHVQYRGYQYTRAKKFRRMQCQSCGQWSRSLKAEKTNGR